MGLGRGRGQGSDWVETRGAQALAAPGPSFPPILPTCFLFSVLTTEPTLSMGLLVTTAASGTSSSAPVEHGNFQAPLGRYLPVDCGMALGLRARTKGPWVFPELEGGRLESGGWSFSSNSISYFQGPEPEKFSERCLKAASLSADLVSPSRRLSCPGWVSWLLPAQTGRCCCSVCPIPRPCWLSSP